MKKLFFTGLALFFLFLHSERIPIPDIYPTSMPSPRIKGMGGAGTALFPDATAAFWNPALLGGLDAAAVMFVFSEEDSSSYARLIEREPSVFGKHISFFTLSTYQGGFSYHPLYIISYRDSFEETLGYERDFELKLDQYILTLTTFAGSDEQYETPLIIGFNVKYLNGRFAETRLYYDTLGSIVDASADIAYGNGYGLDAGIIYRLSKLSVGFMARDIITHVYWGGYDKQIIPMYTSLGLSFNPVSTLLLAVDINRIIKSDMPFLYRTGIEYTFQRNITESTFFSNLSGGSPSIRMGTSFTELMPVGFMEISFGLGYTSNMFRFDIGTEGKFENYLYGGFSYQLSLTLPFKI